MKTKLLFMIVMIIISITINAQILVNDIYYHLNEENHTAQVTLGDSAYSGDIIIPSIVQYNNADYNVVSIGEYAFSYSSITSISLPNSITTIGIEAFSSCQKIRSINIPNSVTRIESKAFAECHSLLMAIIPSSVTFIGSSAFSGCYALAPITIPNSVTTIESGAFKRVANIIYSGSASGSPWGARSVNGYVDGYFVYNDASKTQLLACFTTASGDITIPSTVTSIGNFAFYYCSALASVSIPTSVTKIGNYAFNRCLMISSLTIPDGVSTIGTDAFSDIPNVVYYGSATGAPWGAKCINGWVETPLVYSDATKTTLKACFRNAKGSINIPNTVAIIEREAFSNCDSITYVSIPNSVYAIKRGAFQFCKSLTSVTLPNGLTELGKSAFYNCLALTDITIPSSLSQIEEATFAYCYALTSVSLPNSITSIGYQAFESCRSLAEIDIPSQIATIGYRAFAHCSALPIVSIPSNTISIGQGAFRNCSSLTAINVDASNEYYSSIDGVLFDKNQSLLLRYPAGKEENSYSIPSSVSSINEAFWGCSSLENIDIPESVISIEGYAFQSCYSLQSISFPSSLRTLGECDVLAGCKSLKYIKSEAENPPVARYSTTFYGVNKQIPLYVPKESISLYQNAEGWNEFTIIHSIPEDVENVASQNVKTPHKVIHNGKIFIQRGDKTFTITGAEIK